MMRRLSERKAEATSAEVVFRAEQGTCKEIGDGGKGAKLYGIAGWDGRSVGNVDETKKLDETCHKRRGGSL